MEFILPIDSGKFRSTNFRWNELRLNDPWSVGYVTTLIESRPFSSVKDWEEFYYRSGEERQALISQLDIHTQELLQNELLVKNNKSALDTIGYEVKMLNTQYGRTKEQLYKKGEILFRDLKGIGSEITIEECFECVRFRVIGETWNGVIIRERNTIETLKEKFPTFTFKKVSGETDHQYGVDYEVFNNGKLSFAIQIKPASYLGKAVYILKARQANMLKNQKYNKIFGIKVHTIVADMKGNISNDHELAEWLS
jgi:hypothetical protein